MKIALRTGFVAGLVLVFFILIGIYTVFEALTLSGVWLTILGATASEIAAQVPTDTNPQFTRVLTAFIAVIVGIVAARDAKGWGDALRRAVIAGVIPGVMVALFLLMANALYANHLDLSFVFEKVTAAAVAALLFGQSAFVGTAIWVGIMVGFGLLGACLSVGWRAFRARAPRPVTGVRPSDNRVQLAALIAAGIFLFLAPLFIGVYWNQVLGSIGLFVLLGLGLNIVVGFAGLLDLGYVGFFAIGAYVMALLTAPEYPAKLTFWLALPFAMIAAAIAGTLLGIPVLRLRGDYLAIVTLGFGEIIRIIFKFNPLSGGPQGILNVAAPTFTIPLVNYTVAFTSSTPFWYLILFACIIVAFIAARLNDSRTGRAWTAMRENEDAAEAMGVDTTRAKLLAFGTGAFFAGLGGAIYASRQQHIFPDDFTLLVSINALALIIIGGLGSIPGVIIGSAVLIGLPEILRPISDYRLLAYSALLVVMMLVRPEGLIPSARRQREVHERDLEELTIEST
jgi:ABC-type branched-subunit amino acid transport system permease subunit